MTVRISGKLGLKGSSGLNFRNVYKFLPSMLFAKGEQGVWYDPSDFSTMFQDAAGTTPVTAVEQPVGRILDKSGRGNHATQSTLGNRPVLSARYNLLTKTEQFDDAYWGKTNVSISANTTSDPVGGSTADTLFETIANGFHAIRSDLVVVATSGQSYTFSSYIKDNGRTKGYLSVVSGGGYSVFDLTAKTNVFGGNGTNETVSAQTITELSNGWFLLTITSTFSGSANVRPTIGISNDVGASLYIGDITKGFYIWGADLRVANDGVGLPVYQRVNTSTDYDTVGFPPYLRFDGSDDGMATGTINPGSVDKAQVFAGVRKLSDGSRGCVVEFGNLGTPTNGSFFINAPIVASFKDYTFSSGGTSARNAEYINAAVVAPTTNVLSGVGDISGDSSILRVNGSQVAQNTGDQGTGNYTSQNLFIGRRAGTSLPFNGRLYGLIVRFSSTNLSAIEIDAAEKWVNSKTRAY